MRSRTRDRKFIGLLDTPEGLFCLEDRGLVDRHRENANICVHVDSTHAAEFSLTGLFDVYYFCIYKLLLLPLLLLLLLLLMMMI